MSKEPSGLEYSKVAEIKGPLLVVEGVEKAAFDELVEIEDTEGNRRLARVLETGFGRAVVQVFEGTSGLSVSGTRARFLGRTMELPVSDQLLGRVFDGLGRPLDGLPEPVAKDFRDINGAPINPERREYPTDLIQTGISVIDGMLTLVRGQKLPIFSGAGLPHNMLAAQVARQATVRGEGEEFAVVFAAIGVSHGEASFFKKTLEESGAIRRSILYLNLADDPAIERIITPRAALTAAEYLAFELDMHVLVILTDMTNYCFHGDTEIILGNGEICRIRDFVESLLPRMDNGILLQIGSGKQILLQAARINSSLCSNALTWDEVSVIPSRILSVQRVLAPSKLIHIITRSGAEMKVTEDHKILVDTEEGPELIPASELREGMEVYSVRRIDLEPKELNIVEILAKEGKAIRWHLRDDMNRKSANQDHAHTTRPFTSDELLEIALRLGIPFSEILNRICCITDGNEVIHVKSAILDSTILRIAGMLLSHTQFEGDSLNGYLEFSDKSKELVQFFLTGLQSLFPKVDTELYKEGSLWIGKVKSQILANLFTNIIFTGGKGELVRVFQSGKDNVSAFLSGYLDGNGSVSVSRRLIKYTANSMGRAKRIQLLLKRLGIYSSVTQQKRGNRFDVIISGAENLLIFADLIKPIEPNKREAINLLRNLIAKIKSKSTYDLAPRVCGRLIKRIREKYKLSRTKIGSQSTISKLESKRSRASRQLLRSYLERISTNINTSDKDYKRLLELLNGNYILDRVRKVEIVENKDERYVYDITVSQTHKIIAENGIITSNCEALREISAAREEVPGRKGFPGYLYTDLATNYERAGRIKGKRGSITQMPILSMPSDDVTHPIPDLTGYITEGQIFLGRELFRKDIYPPVYVLNSLSRLMGPALGKVIKEGKARADHHQVGNQLYNAYARAVELRALAEIVGRSGLSPIDLKYLRYGDEFEQKFLKQGYDENRTFEDTLRIAWEVLSILPESELTNIREEFISKYYVKGISE